MEQRPEGKQSKNTHSIQGELVEHPDLMFIDERGRMLKVYIDWKVGRMRWATFSVKGDLKVGKALEPAGEQGFMSVNDPEMDAITLARSTGYSQLIKPLGEDPKNISNTGNPQK